MGNLSLNLLAAILSGLSALSFQAALAQQPKAWQAPASVQEIKNPFRNDANAALEGKKIYISMCAICHGDKGKGNGAASVALTPHPANFLSIEVANESDGSIFWKMTEGRSPMAAYKTLLTDQQRWQLVTYIRKLEERK